LLSPGYKNQTGIKIGAEDLHNADKEKGWHVARRALRKQLLLARQSKWLTNAGQD